MLKTYIMVKKIWGWGNMKKCKSTHMELYWLRKYVMIKNPLTEEICNDKESVNDVSKWILLTQQYL